VTRADFWLIFVLFCGSLILLPLLRRIRLEPARRAPAPDEPAPVVHAE
jgi:hypothetical protein